MSHCPRRAQQLPQEVVGEEGSVAAWSELPSRQSAWRLGSAGQCTCSVSALCPPRATAEMLGNVHSKVVPFLPRDPRHFQLWAVISNGFLVRVLFQGLVLIRKTRFVLEFVSTLMF